MSNLDRVQSVVMTMAAVILVGFVVRAELRGPSTADAAAPRWVDDWRSLVDVGQHLGGGTGEAYVIEFVDLQCPGCRIFHEGALRAAQERFGNRVSVVLVHFPLPSHPYAYTAAVAAACAGAQGKATEFVDVVFANQQSLGARSWEGLGEEAGVADVQQFHECVQTPSDPVTATVEAGRQAGVNAGVMGTPTVMVNGWWFAQQPTTEELVRVIEAVLEGTDPFAT